MLCVFGCWKLGSYFFFSFLWKWLCLNFSGVLWDFDVLIKEFSVDLMIQKSPFFCLFFLLKLKDNLKKNRSFLGKIVLSGANDSVIGAWNTWNVLFWFWNKDSGIVNPWCRLLHSKRICGCILKCYLAYYLGCMRIAPGYFRLD